ncbi:MAG: hypothetical protein J6O18_02365 [Bacilli bacterium]|nr:hypothetical protein [Bacilli bacterium]
MLEDIGLPPINRCNDDMPSALSVKERKTLEVAVEILGRVYAKNNYLKQKENAKHLIPIGLAFLRWLNYC